MASGSRFLTRRLAIAVLAGTLAGSIGLMSRPALVAASTLDYAMVFTANGVTLPTVTVRLSDTNGTLSGTGHTQCTPSATSKLKITGTLSGTTVAMTMTFVTVQQCKGLVLHVSGTLTHSSGQGAFTSNRTGLQGTWTASDPTANVRTNATWF